MKKFVVAIIVIFTVSNSIVLLADSNGNPQGWHWYNQQPEQKKEIPPSSPGSAQSALDQLHAIQKAYNEAKAKAVLYPTEQNIYRYLQLQTVITNQSSRFAMMWPKVLLDHPELDYSIQHPTSQLAIQSQRSQDTNKKIAAVKALAQIYGLLFFYRGNNPSDEIMAKTLKSFCDQYGIALIPISMDGQISPDLPQTKINSGQAQTLGIHYFPALILVNPKTKATQALAYGFMAEDVLLDRFLSVSENFNGGW